MNRIFHPWDLWEDHKHNFYGGEPYDTDKADEKCVQLLTDSQAFEKALREITTTWTHSCEHNLTNASLNHIAYLGQAACALRFRVPHTKTMGYFNLLTDEQKILADDVAKKYYDLWVEKHESIKKV